MELKNDEIKKDNRMVEAAIGGLGLNSFKLLLFMTTDFSMENVEETEESYRIKFRTKDFLDTIGYKSENGYSEVRKYLKQLRSVTIELPIWEGDKETGTIITGFIDKAWVYKKGTMMVRIDKEMMPYLHKFKLEKETTILRYNLMKQFESYYSTRIYELLIRWKNTAHKKVTFEIEELKEKLGVKEKYKVFRDFDKYVLMAAMKEINEKSDILMGYKKLALGEASGKGRKPITHIEFSFKMKNDQQVEELLSDPQIEELLELAEKRVMGSDKTAKGYFDYAFASALEGCNNKKGFYKYMKRVLLEDKTFLGQISMNINPEFRAMTKAEKIHKQMAEEKKRRAKQLREQSDVELEAQIEADRQERLKNYQGDQAGEISFDFLKRIGEADENN